VYSLTERQRDAGAAWFNRPATLGAIALGAALVLNVIFF
jgi:hypothetical protein